MCGGEYDTGNKFDDGYIIGQPNKKLHMLEKRFEASGVGETKIKFYFGNSKDKTKISHFQQFFNYNNFIIIIFLFCVVFF